MKTHLNDLFDKMEPEKGNTIDDKIQVLPSKVNEIIEGFKSQMSNINRYRSKTLTEIYSDTKNFAPKNCFSRDIEKFIQAAPHLVDINFACIGIYLSYLMNQSEDQEFNLNLNTSLEGIRFLGMYNTEKTIKTTGFPRIIGMYMTGGRIEINGNISYLNIQELSGGTIEINGFLGVIEHDLQYAGKTPNENLNIIHNKKYLIKNGVVNNNEKYIVRTGVHI